MKRTFYLLTILLTSLILASCKKNSPDNPHSAGTLTDICGNTYNYVKIGSQYWMAENMRCNRYDTKSEMAGKTITNTDLKGHYVPTYFVAYNKSMWNTKSKTETGINISEEQLESLGYLYNWAAAVGIEDNTKQTSFKEKRQGICPNGWHVPTSSEWELLGNTLGGNKDSDGTFYSIGKNLKTTSGWYVGNGTDKYGFSALPAVSASGTSVWSVGQYTEFWTATNIESKAILYRLSGTTNDLIYSYEFGGEHWMEQKSVRCLKD